MSGLGARTYDKAIGEVRQFEGDVEYLDEVSVE